MSSQPTTTALAKRNVSSALMLPPPPPKRIKRPSHVLPEEIYEDVLSHIIARDFFPGLLETESQSEFLDALESQNQDWIEDSGRRVREHLSTPRPGRTPLPQAPRGESPSSVSAAKSSSQIPGAPAPPLQAKDEVGRDVEHHPERLKTLSLQQFQALYTSEDNASFNRVLDRQNMRDAEKKAWLFNGNRIPSNRRLAQASVRDRQHQRLLAAAPDPTDLNSQALTLRPSNDLSSRPAGPDVRPEKPLNNLMFNADDLSETHPHLPTQHDAAQSASVAAPRSVQHTATRLPTPSLADADADDTASITNSVAISAIDRAIRARLRPSHPTEPDAPNDPMENGYEYVDDEPTPAELHFFSTHGSLAAASHADAARRHHDTARTLDAMRHAAGPAAGPGGFAIAPQSRREDLRDRLVEKHSRQHAGAGPGTPRATPGRATPTPGRRGAGDLTPAGLRLAGLLGRTPARAREGDGRGSAREVWSTATPRGRRKREGRG